MSTTRPNFKPKVVAALVLWTSPLYSLENLQKYAEQESDPHVNNYLHCLIAFKNKGNSDALLERLIQLTKVVTKVVTIDAQFEAAIYNLLGLTYRRLADYNKALESFAIAMPFVKWKPISHAVLCSHFGYALHEQQNIGISPLLYPTSAVKEIEELPVPEDLDDRQNIAAIYCGLAFAYRKADLVNNADLAERSYNNALGYWPESRRIANDRAILLSKINSLVALLKSEAHWAVVYEDAKRNLSFEECYYRADVAIKLAAFHSFYGFSTHFDNTIKAASEYLQSAENSLTANGTHAAKASLYKLYARFAYIQGDITLANENNVIAKDLRSTVPEDADKKTKFVAGLVKTNRTGLNSVNALFRYKPRGNLSVVTTAAEDKSFQPKP